MRDLLATPVRGLLHRALFGAELAENAENDGERIKQEKRNIERFVPGEFSALSALSAVKVFDFF